MKNFEFKVKVASLTKYEQRLLTLQPEFRGTDHQVDTYFNVKSGRLKLREGNIENALIHYERSDLAGAKRSDILLYRCQPDPTLKAILTLHFGIRAVVEKIRKIYFIGDVKFHFDDVKNLGLFVEAEAIDPDEKYAIEQLKSLSDKYFNFFGFGTDMLVGNSYSDMLV